MFARLLLVVMSLIFSTGCLANHNKIDKVPYRFVGKFPQIALNGDAAKKINSEITQISLEDTSSFEVVVAKAGLFWVVHSWSGSPGIHGDTDYENIYRWDVSNGEEISPVFFSAFNIKPGMEKQFLEKAFKPELYYKSLSDKLACYDMSLSDVLNQYPLAISPGYIQDPGYVGNDELVIRNESGMPGVIFGCAFHIGIDKENLEKLNSMILFNEKFVKYLPRFIAAGVIAPELGSQIQKLYKTSTVRY